MDGQGHLSTTDSSTESVTLSVEELAYVAYCLECGRGFGLSDRFEAGFRLLVQITAMIPLGVGAFILGGGERRFSSPAFLVPGNIMPWWAWGSLFLLAGLILGAQAIRFSKQILWGSVAVSFMYLFFAMSLALSIVLEPNLPPDAPRAAGTGIAAYTGLAGLTLTAGVIASWRTVDAMSDFVRHFPRRIKIRGDGGKSGDARPA